MSNKIVRTSITINEDTKLDATKIAKRQGFNTFTGLVGRLVYEYVEKNREILNRENHPRK
jgi:hypothetical protein